MDENKKSIWYKIGKALKGSNIPSDQEVLIADPTAQLGYNIGIILADFLNKLNSSELNELFDGTPVIADPTAQLGYLLGVGVDNSSANNVTSVSASSTAGSIVVQNSQTLTTGIVLTFQPCYQTINFNGDVTINSFPSSNQTVYFDIDSIITVGAAS